MYPQAVDAPRLPAFVCRIVGRHCGSGEADGDAEEILAPPSRPSGTTLFRRSGLRAKSARGGAGGDAGGSHGGGSGVDSALAAKAAKAAAYQTRGTHWMTRTGKLVQAKGSTDVFVRAKGAVAGQ